MVVSFLSTTIKRVCRATFQAKIYSRQNAHEAGNRVRALLAELCPNWCDAAGKQSQSHVMLPDCRSRLVAKQHGSACRVQDKWLQIELDAISQSIFDDDGRRTSEVYSQGRDRVDWVTTATPIADFRTKSMKPTQMLTVLDTCNCQISREVTRSLMQVVK